ncbi:MAG: trypsin-like peptidase domain-containing protein [Saprospiraceae bacterium]|nr:trypsin-like peptidase domain-containing protein [Saprospiraceae bacterium]
MASLNGKIRRIHSPLKTENMKFFIVFIISIAFSTDSFCQFGTSRPCHLNVNAIITDQARALEKKAVFRFKINKLNGSSAFCTSTLINRDMNLNNMGFYFVTATHCISDDNGNLDIDLGVEHDLIFNFQSPNLENNETALSNRGSRGSFQSLSLVDEGFQYLHRSRLRLVEFYKRNDFAIFEILKPIPPHFQVTYAGWSTSGPQFIFNPINSNHYAVIHHPSGDIKKISKTNWVLGGNPISSGCRAVTKLIDGLFGWIWGRRWSTEVVCGFVENTHATVVQWNTGNTEPGSSGSALLDNNNRVIGVLTGDATPITTTCGGFRGLKRFGKFRTSYFKQTVKNALNPSNNCCERRCYI